MTMSSFFFGLTVLGYLLSMYLYRIQLYAFFHLVLAFFAVLGYNK